MTTTTRPSAPQRLVARLVAEGLMSDPAPGWTFHRTYAGRVQREAGAWSWWIQNERGDEVLASFWPVGDLLAEPALTVGRSRYDPCPIVDPTHRNG